MIWQIKGFSVSSPSIAFKQDIESDWIGLHLFNDDTRPSGHISRPSQVGFAHRCLRSINEF